MSDRIYCVTDATTNSETFVEAGSQAEAVRIVIGNRYSAKSASSTDMLRAMQVGAVVITRLAQGGASAP